MENRRWSARSKMDELVLETVGLVKGIWTFDARQNGFDFKNKAREVVILSEAKEVQKPSFGSNFQ